MEVINAAVHFVKKKMHVEVEVIDEANVALTPSEQLNDLVDQILESEQTHALERYENK